MEHTKHDPLCPFCQRWQRREGLVNARVFTEFNWIPVSARLQGNGIQDAVDGAGLNGQVKIYENKPGNERKKKWNLMKTAPGVVAEVKNKMC